ncbi:PTH2-domain-containing protein [Pleomassaria siparia CBS 279.74]|uniref:peptidyl-tRNA hydrolase n=1 Tax=Pleomassaria siparia CBS 279.74 TaxID=1314801 RepID=A0A6G1KHN7_9PLEO|nr:PTH2-domain-containing protein [Pleomassaria siparia CBS 279.74]
MADKPPPTTASIAIASALIAGVTGYFIGQAKQLGLFGGSPVRIPSDKDRKKNADESDGDYEDSSDDEEGPLSEFPGHGEECKLVLVVRTDLGMTKGKIGAQCGHATLACYKHFLKNAPNSPILKRWERSGQMKVALQVKSEEELEMLQARALSLGLSAHIIHDAGRTQIASGSATVFFPSFNCQRHPQGLEISRPGTPTTELKPEGVDGSIIGRTARPSTEHTPRGGRDSRTQVVGEEKKTPSGSFPEMNRIRAEMGVAPLPVPGATGPAFKAKNDDPEEEPASTIETREAAGFDNWRKLEEEAAKKKQREERAATIRKEREKAQRFAKLEGKGLAESAPEEDDLAWLKGSKKRQKKIAKAEKTQREHEEREREAQAALQYTEADLAGVKVGHELDQFDDGEDQILVLKDTAVDADEDDELEAVSLKERERLQEKIDSKKRKRAYDPNAMDEAGQSSILAQYDEEIDGKKHKAFTLNGQGNIVEEAQRDASGVPKPKKVAVSLDFLKEEVEANDYMDISEVKVKKSKKKKSKSSRRKHVENEEDAFAIPEEAAEEDMEIDEPENVAPKPKKILFEGSFVDDDDLQASLKAQRQKALKKKHKKLGPADLARQIREEASAPQTPDIQDTIEEDEEPGLIIDETTEFVENLHQPGTAEDAEERPRKRQKSSQPSNGINSVGVDEEGDVDMAQQSYAEVGEERQRSASIGITGTGLDEEKTIDQGLGATLALLKQRGVITTSESGDMNALYRERQHFLNERQRAEAAAERLAKEQRERERTSSRWHNMTPREREEWARKNNTNRDQLESRKLADIFNKEYKPNVTLNYVDEHGRHMNQKEAFKKLSHQFHGKTSGNTKTQKHLDKIAAEKKKEAESALQTTHTGGLGSARGQQAKKTKQAGVRLL